MDLTRRFSNAISQNRLAHALLFLGEDEISKEQTALSLLSYFFCEHPVLPFGCGTCAVCLQILEKRHPRVRFLIPESESSQEIRVDSVRELIHAPGNPSWIIPQAHLLNSQASNALLKTLEEPRANQTFILMAPSIQSITPTLASRCQRIGFASKKAPETEKPLKIPEKPLDKLEFIEQLIKEKKDLSLVLESWHQNASCDFRERLLGAQEDLKRHVNPQLILESLLF